MPEFIITSPDGQKFRITAPEGATAADLPDLSGGGKPREPSGVMDFIRSIPRGLVGGLASFGELQREGQRGFLGINPEDLPEHQRQTSEETTEAIEKNIGKMHKPETVAGQYAETIAQSVSNPASYVGPGGLAAKAGLAALSGAGAETAGQLTDQNPVARFIGGAIAPGLPRAASRVVSPSTIPEIRKPFLEQLRARGVEPTAGDVTGSRTLRHKEEMGDLPMGGSSFSRNKEDVARQYTRAAAQRMGVDEDLLTPEVFQRVEQDLGRKFESAARNMQINYDNGLAQGLMGVVQDAFKEGLPREVIDRLHAQVRHVNSGFITRENAPAYMPGRNYQAVTRHGTPLQRAMDDKDPNVAYYATRIRSELDDAMERSAHARGTREGTGRRQALADLREARRQWYNMIVLKRSVAGPGEAAAEGLLSPQKLRQNLTNSPDAKMNYAAGRGDLHDLSRAGNAIMTPLPSSGTAERAKAWTIPGMVSGAAGRAINSGPVQDWLKNQRAVPFRQSLPPPGWTAARGGTAGAMSSPDALAPEASGDALSPFEQGIADFAHGGLIGVMKGRGIEMPDWVNQANDFLHSEAFNDALGVVGRVGRPIAVMRSEGLSWKEIANELGISENKAYRLGAKEGLAGDVYETGSRSVPPIKNAPQKWTKEYGMPGSTKWQLEFGQIKESKSSRPWGPNLTADGYEKVVDKINEGKSIKEIADEMKLKEETVRKVFEYDKKLSSNRRWPK